MEIVGNRVAAESRNEFVKRYVPSGRNGVRETAAGSDAETGDKQGSRIRRVAMDSGHASNGNSAGLPGSGDPHVQEVVRAAKMSSGNSCDSAQTS